jgi:hypothetical protein
MFRKYVFTIYGWMVIKYLEENKISSSPFGSPIRLLMEMSRHGIVKLGLLTEHEKLGVIDTDRALHLGRQHVDFFRDGVEHGREDGTSF